MEILGKICVRKLTHNFSWFSFFAPFEKKRKQFSKAMTTNHRVWHSGFFGANIQMQEDNFDQKKESQFDILHRKN